MNIVRIYNQKRKFFWMAIIVIAFALIGIQIINANIGNTSSKISQNNATSDVDSNTIIENKYVSNKSGVTGRTIKKEELTSVENLLNEFFGYCNNKELEKAYNLLTDECKETNYPSLKSFEDNYYNNVFQNKKKTYNFENWNQNTYLVRIYEDPLITGRVEKTEDKKNDYVTVIGDKLNISSYIGREAISKEQIQNDIKFIVNNIDTFMDYQVYNITVTNNSKNTVCLGLVNDSKNIYLEDDNEIKYGFYNHEVIQNELVIKQGYTFNISLKFYSSYVSTKKIKHIVFNNVFENYQNDNTTTKIKVEV